MRNAVFRVILIRFVTCRGDIPANVAVKEIVVQQFQITISNGRQHREIQQN